MANPKLGKKRTCQDCGAHYYDLNAKDPKCPKCGAAFAPPAPARGKSNVKKPPKEAEKAVPVKTDEDDAVEEDDLDSLVEDDDEKHDSDDDDLIADASDLGTDDDDLSEVREHIDEEVIDRSD